VSSAVVTLSGLPGSGKTTAGRRVAELLRLEFTSAGELFRNAAAERGLDLLAFSHLAERDDSIDRGLDDRMLTLARPGRMLEGRVTGALCRQRGVPCTYLELTAREEVRVERVARRDGTTPEETRHRLKEREASEQDRYRRYYGIDLAREPADCVVDSSDLGVDAVVRRFVEFLKNPATSDDS
jgi:predicted cytidylate kinase